MTIQDQIKDEKLQYYINSEAAKISALSSGKIDKNEYLTGEEILSSNQQQMKEQAKFTYSPLGKDFENQTKIINDHGGKQVDALESFKSLKRKDLKAIKYEDFYIDKVAEIRNSTKQIDFNDLTYIYKGESGPIGFIGFIGPLHIFKSIYNGDIALEDVAKD